MLLAVETSCDETALALIDDSRAPGAEGFVVAERIASQINLHRAYGGVVPEIAAREHLQVLPALFSSLCEDAGIGRNQLTAVAATCGPGLKGALLVGFSYAKALAFGLEIPFYPVNHLEGHVLAGWLLPAPEQPTFPYVCLLVSGGHTQLILVRQFRSYELLASTRDDAAGEAFDKIATLLGLPYPGGPALSSVAAAGAAGAHKFPIAVPWDATSFSFSGLKTSVHRLVDDLSVNGLQEPTRNDIALAAEQAIVSALVQKSVEAVKTHRPASFVLSGGVAANRPLREALSSSLSALGVPFIAPPPRWCTDNGAMIGLVGYYLHHSRASNAPVRVDDIATVRPRWPLSELSAP